MEFDDIGNAVQAVAARGYGDGTQDAGGALSARTATVNLLVQGTSLCRELVIGPELFKVNQRPLPRAKQPVLECRNREGDAQTRSVSWTPRGRFSTSI